MESFSQQSGSLGSSVQRHDASSQGRKWTQSTGTSLESQSTVVDSLSQRLHLPEASLSSSSRYDTTWESRKLTMDHIEEAILKIIDQIEENKLPILSRTIINQSTKKVTKSKINLGNNRSRKKFTMIVKILTRAFQLLQTETTLTKRDLYYEDVQFYGNQINVNNAINDIAQILEVSLTSLPFESSVKGLLAFDEKTELKWTDLSGNEVPLVGTKNIVPTESVLKSWGKFVSNARFVLIVEKDAIFERLMAEDIFEKLEPFILVTGKGYADRPTRRLCCKLSQDLQIPTFALVDANPYGLEIAAIYKWGSEKLNGVSNGNTELIVPNLTLLGLLPSDLNMLAIPESSTEPLNTNDIRKLSSLAARIQHQTDQSTVEPTWNREIDEMKLNQRKAEIEAVSSLGTNFLTGVYLRGKIRDYFQNSQSQNFLSQIPRSQNFLSQIPRSQNSLSQTSQFLPHQ